MPLASKPRNNTSAFTKGKGDGAKTVNWKGLTPSEATPLMPVSSCVPPMSRQLPKARA